MILLIQVMIIQVMIIMPHAVPIQSKAVTLFLYRSVLETFILRDE